MKLYDNDRCREEFMEIIYNLLSSDLDNSRANQIIAAFDNIPAVETLPVEIPFEELLSVDRRTIYVVCWDDPAQSGWAVLHAERNLDKTVLQLQFVSNRKQQVCLTEVNYHRPWVPCYREPVKSQDSVFVSGERYRRLKTDYNALKQELDLLKANYLNGAGLV